jgi:branched-chain amino acid transport system substrate-binding protein
MSAVRRLLPLGLLALLAAGCSPRAAPEPVWVGHVAPLSGPDRAVGEHAQQGIDLAVDEANADGNGINGRPVRVRHADSRGEPQTAQEQAVRLVTVNRVSALLGGSATPELEALGRGLQAYDAPLVSPATLPPALSNENVFSTTVPAAYQGEILARFAAAELKPANITVIADSRSAVSAALAAAFVRETAKAGIARPEEWTYAGESEFADLVARVKKAQPKALLLAGAARDLLKLRPKVQEADPQAALLLGAEEGSITTLAEDRGTPGAAYLVSAFAVEGLTPAGQELARKYRERFGQDLDVHAALAYDNARLLFDALRRAKGGGDPSLRKALLGTDNFDALTGPLAFTPERAARRPVFVLRLEGGQAKLGRRYEQPEKQAAAPAPGGKALAAAAAAR